MWYLTPYSKGSFHLTTFFRNGAASLSCDSSLPTQLGLEGGLGRNAEFCVFQGVLGRTGFPSGFSMFCQGIHREPLYIGDLYPHYSVLAFHHPSLPCECLCTGLVKQSVCLLTMLSPVLNRIVLCLGQNHPAVLTGPHFKGRPRADWSS